VFGLEPTLSVTGNAILLAEVRGTPGIMEFLGYNPLPFANVTAWDLMPQRTTLAFAEAGCCARRSVARHRRCR